MKKNTKTILIIGGVLVGAGLIYYFFFRSKDEVPAPSSSSFEPYVPGEAKKGAEKGVEFVPDEMKAIVPTVPSTITSTPISSDLKAKATSATGSTLTLSKSTGIILPKTTPTISGTLKPVTGGFIK